MREINPVLFSTHSFPKFGLKVKSEEKETKEMGGNTQKEEQWPTFSSIFPGNTQGKVQVSPDSESQESPGEKGVKRSFREMVAL